MMRVAKLFFCYFLKSIKNRYSQLLHRAVVIPSSKCPNGSYNRVTYKDICWRCEHGHTLYTVKIGWLVMRGTHWF